MKYLVVKRSVRFAGRNTSISLEDAFWKGLGEIAKERGVSASRLVETINAEQRSGSLSSAIRLFVLAAYRERARRSATE